MKPGNGQSAQDMPSLTQNRPVPAGPDGFDRARSSGNPAPGAAPAAGREPGRTSPATCRFPGRRPVDETGKAAGTRSGIRPGTAHRSGRCGSSGSGPAPAGPGVQGPDQGRGVGGAGWAGLGWRRSTPAARARGSRPRPAATPAPVRPAFQPPWRRTARCTPSASPSRREAGRRQRNRQRAVPAGHRRSPGRSPVLGVVRFLPVAPKGESASRPAVTVARKRRHMDHRCGIPAR